MRLFLDANILFAASNPKTSVAVFINRIAERVTLVTCDYAVTEAQRNLLRKWPQHVGEFKRLLTGMEIIAAALDPVPVELAAKDVPILSSAIAGKCDYLITGDRADFGHLFDLTIRGVVVIEPARMADALGDLL